jgi:arginyl-tRNA--protein-N-Asp/Glu arginylyltransferase
MSYLNFGEKEVDTLNAKEVADAYNQGFVFIRKSLGAMEKIRSVRINLEEFELSSENRRILGKYSDGVQLVNLPYPNYSWQIHKLGKDFYDAKFGKDTFSANKIQEIFTTTSTNFNAILEYKDDSTNLTKGYCICYNSDEEKIVHYSYPFYNLDLINSNFGMFMMTSAVKFFKEKGYKYIYLGSAHSNASKYKLQFKGLEWFDEKSNEWSKDIEELKIRIQ